MSDEIKRNFSNKIMLELDLADLMIVADALSIGSTTARFSYNKKAQSDRLTEIRHKICEFLPIPKRAHRDGGYAWFDTVKAIQNCSYYDVFVIETKDTWSKREPKYTLAVDVNNTRFLISEDTISGAVAYEAVEPLLELFDQHAPTDAVRLTNITADVILTPEETSYDFEKARPYLQAAIDRLGTEHGFHARIRHATTNYSNKVGDDYPYTVVVAVPSHQHELVRQAFAETITKLEQEAGADTPAPRI